MSRRGNNVTPWLLGRVHELTNGSSLESSTNLVVVMDQTPAPLIRHLTRYRADRKHSCSWYDGIYFFRLRILTWSGTGSQIAVKYAELLKDQGEQSPNHV